MRDYKFRQHDFAPRRRPAGGRRLLRSLLILLALGGIGYAVHLYWPLAGETSGQPPESRPPAIDGKSLIIPLQIPPDGTLSPAPAGEGTPPAVPAAPAVPPPATILTPPTEDSATAAIPETSEDVPAASDPSLIALTATAAIQAAPEANEGGPAASDPSPIARAASPSSGPVAPAAPDEPLPQGRIEHRVAAGETLAILFRRYRLPPQELTRLLRIEAKAARQLAALKPGDLLRFEIAPDRTLRDFELAEAGSRSLRLQPGSLAAVASAAAATPTTAAATPSGSAQRPDGPAAAKSAAPAPRVAKDRSESEAAPTPKDGVHAVRKSAVIKGSLYGAARSAGIPDSVVAEMTRVFRWDIDYSRDVKRGDRLTLVYEERWKQGTRKGIGALLAAEFVNGGKTYRAVRHTDDRGRAQYLTPEGKPLRKTFFRAPLEMTRITSGFTQSRLHPVLGIWRAHHGVDYAAPAGTPVLATGDGVVKARGYENGYGNLVQIQHGRAYTTVYGHLSRFAKGLKVGDRVAQGQVIGYVGQTGIATGPHLHYEFRIDGKPKNPLTVKADFHTPMTAVQQRRFQENARNLVALLDGRGKSFLVSNR